MAKTKSGKKVTKVDRDRSTVFAYANFDELNACLLSGWSPATTREYLVNRFNDNPDIPSDYAIRRWRDKHCPTAAVVPPEFIREKLQGLDYKVDVLAHLSRMIRLLEDRLSRSLAKEEALFEGMPLAITDQAVRSYLDSLREYVSVSQDLGLMKAKAPPVLDFSSKTLIITPDAMRELKEVAEEIKAIGSPK